MFNEKGCQRRLADLAQQILGDYRRAGEKSSFGWRREPKLL
jgi:hypothetical protein